MRIVQTATDLRFIPVSRIEFSEMSIPFGWLCIDNQCKHSTAVPNLTNFYFEFHEADFTEASFLLFSYTLRRKCENDL